MKKGTGGSRKPAAGGHPKGRSPSKRNPKKQGGGAKRADEVEERVETQQEDDTNEDKPLQAWQKVLIFFGVLLIISLFILLNWLILVIIATFFGPFLAKLILFFAYTYLVRLAVRYFAFPGSFQISRRQLEFQYA